MRKVFCVVAVLLSAACAASPTAVSEPANQPRHPAYNGLFGGSGNLTDAGATAANTSTTQTAAATEVTATDTVMQRSGVFGGSGN